MTRALAFVVLLGACAGTSRNAATCSAYEATAEVARKACHWACDRIPSSCPWRDVGAGEEAGQ